MTRAAPISAAASLLLIGGCSPGDPTDSGRTTLTMYLSETDIAACLERAGDAANDPVEIGGFVYTHYPEDGLVCRSDRESRPLAAFMPESNRTASHRWIMVSGFGILGTKHTFGPVPADRPQS